MFSFLLRFSRKRLLKKLSDKKEKIKLDIFILFLVITKKYNNQKTFTIKNTWAKVILVESK
tara:strand:- start:679 stop:861 length:183 start_codon:yes stop_codon:yes gene_type:complete